MRDVVIQLGRERLQRPAPCSPIQDLPHQVAGQTVGQCRDWYGQGFG